MSSNKEIFDEAAEYYEKALNKCGYRQKLTYVEPIQCDEIRRGNAQKRNIIWFNPPFSKNFDTNVDKYFLNLINKHFPKNHKFSKIFNKNTLKLSCSWMPNLKEVYRKYTHNRQRSFMVSICVDCEHQSQKIAKRTYKLQNIKN